MKFRDNAYALGSAGSVEVEIVELIDLILVMLGEPILRNRETIVLFELHIRRSEWEPDQPLSDFGNATRRGMFRQWRLPKRKRLVRNRIHVSSLNWSLMRSNVHQNLPCEKTKIDSDEEFCGKTLVSILAWTVSTFKKRRCLPAISCGEYLRFE
jgi:hypothetical protein